MNDHHLKAGPAKLGQPTLKSYTREQHDQIVKLMEQGQLSWEDACAAYEEQQDK